MALTTTLSLASVTASHASDFSVKKLSPFKTNDHRANFLDKRASASRSNINISINGPNFGENINKFDGQNLVLDNLSLLVKKMPVSPLQLEDALRPPTDLYSAEAPHTATIVSVEMIAPPSEANPHGTYHIIFDHGGFLPHWEGQVFGVMPAPENPYKPGDAKKIRFFSVASSRYGDYFDGKTASFCVYGDPTSDFMTNAKPGDKLQMTGPVGEAMLLGDNENPNGIHIMVATGTAVAPFRAHLRRLFMEDIPNFNFSGLAWLFAGHSTDATQLYKNEFMKYLSYYPANFRYNVALSQEQMNKVGGEKYVQDTFEDHAEEVFDYLVKGAYIYFAGYKDIVYPIENALKKVAENRHLNWDEIFAQFKRNNQWRVEVY